MTTQQVSNTIVILDRPLEEHIDSLRRLAEEGFDPLDPNSRYRKQKAYPLFMEHLAPDVRRRKYCAMHAKEVQALGEGLSVIKSKACFDTETQKAQLAAVGVYVDTFINVPRIIHVKNLNGWRQKIRDFMHSGKQGTYLQQ